MNHNLSKNNSQFQSYHRHSVVQNLHTCTIIELRKHFKNEHRADLGEEIQRDDRGKKRISYRYRIGKIHSFNHRPEGTSISAERDSPEKPQAERSLEFLTSAGPLILAVPVEQVRQIEETIGSKLAERGKTISNQRAARQVADYNKNREWQIERRPPRFPITQIYIFNFRLRPFRAALINSVFSLLISAACRLAAPPLLHPCSTPAITPRYRLPSRLSTIFQLPERKRSKLIVTPTRSPPSRLLRFHLLSASFSPPSRLVSTPSSARTATQRVHGGSESGFRGRSLQVIEVPGESSRRRNERWNWTGSPGCRPLEIGFRVPGRWLLALRGVRDKLGTPWTVGQAACNRWES